MKKSTFIIFAGVLSLCTIITSKAYANDLASYEEEYMLDGFTRWCGHTWCRNLYDAEFYSFGCDFNEGRCSLKLAYVSLYDLETEERIEGFYPIECHLRIDSKDYLFSDESRYTDPHHPIRQADACLEEHAEGQRDYFEQLLLENRY